MSPKIKIILLMLSIMLVALACGQLEIGVEPKNEEPSPVSPTNTTQVQSQSDEKKQAAQKKTPTTNTEGSALLPSNTTENSPSPETETEQLRLDCTDFGIDPLVSIACNVEASLISRNTSPLLSYMPPEFALGYWLSEWTTVTPEYVLDYFQYNMLPANPDQLTFTTDPERFPDIGRPIETMLGPDDDVALIIYSEGWNEDGQGAAILFITGNETSGYQFRAMLVSGNHFEMPPSGGDGN